MMTCNRIANFLDEIDWFCISPAAESIDHATEIFACRWLVFKKSYFLRSYFLVNFDQENDFDSADEEYRSLIYRVDFNEETWMHRVSGAMYFSEKFGKGEIVNTRFFASDWVHPNGIFEEACSQYISNHAPNTYGRNFAPNRY